MQQLFPLNRATALCDAAVGRAAPLAADAVCSEVCMLACYMYARLVSILQGLSVPFARYIAGQEGSHCSGASKVCPFLWLQIFGWKQSQWEPAPRVVKSELAFPSVRELSLALIMTLQLACSPLVAGSRRWPFQAHTCLTW